MLKILNRNWICKMDSWVCIAFALYDKYGVMIHYNGVITLVRGTFKGVVVKLWRMGETLMEGTWSKQEDGEWMGCI